MFLERVLAADLPAVLVDDLAGGKLEMIRESLDLDLANPDVPRRAGAAVAALRAGEIQPARVPWLVRLALLRSLQNFQFHRAPKGGVYAKRWSMKRGFRLTVLT